MASITEVVNVTLQTGGKSAQAVNMNACMLVTTEQEVLNTNERFFVGYSLQDIANKFGTLSKVTQYAQVFFANNINPTVAQGYLAVGYFRKHQENTKPNSAKLIGNTLNEEQAISQLRSIVNGEFEITIDTHKIDVKNINFSKILNLKEVATQIEKQLVTTPTPTPPLKAPIRVTLKTDKGNTAIYTASDGVDFEVAKTEVENGVLKENSRKVYEDAKKAKDANIKATPIAKISFSNNRFTIESLTTGKNSIVSFATKITSGSGSYIGDALGLSQDVSAQQVLGADTVKLEPETILDCLNELQNRVGFKGLCFIDSIYDTVNEVATWVQANNVIAYEVFSKPENLEIDPENPVWKVTLSNQKNMRCLFSKANNRKLAISYMSRLHSVNFNAIDSAITMNLKELSVEPEYYSDTEVNKAKNVGLDIYTTIKNIPNVINGIANGFVDNIYNFMAYKDALETDVYNFMHSTSTKIPQTQQGVNSIVNVCIQTTRRFVIAGVFAPGTWTAREIFGDETVFRTAIAKAGFYFLAQDLATQSQADREARKSPPIMGAVKNAGAIHEVDIIVNVNL